MGALADNYTAAAGIKIFGGSFAPVTGRTGDVVLAGDSLTSLAYQSGGYRVGIPLTLYPPRVVYNAGVAGDTIQNLINRFGTDVTNKGASTAIIRIGTNGPGGGTYQDKYTTLFGLLEDADMFGVFHAVPPKSLGTEGITAPFVAQNDWLQAQCEAAPERLAFVVDSDGLGDEFYNAVPSFYITAESGNPIHMNGKGVYTQGVAMAPILADIFAPVEARLLDATDNFSLNPASNQWNSNPHNAGSGSLPNGWTASAYSGAAATTSIVAADGGDAVQVPWLRVTYTASTGGASQHTVRASLTHPEIGTDILRFDVVMEVRLNSLDTDILTSLVFGIDTGGSQITGGVIPINGNGLVTQHMVLRDALPRNSALTYSANALKAFFTLDFSAAHTGAIGSVDIRCVSVRGETA